MVGRSVSLCITPCAGTQHCSSCTRVTVVILRVDLGGSRPLFEQVAAAVRAEIVAGRVRAGDRLPAAREVAAALDINVHTVLRAYQSLRDEGLIDLRRGRGAVVSVAAAPVAALHHDLVALVQRAAVLGVPASALAALIADVDMSAEPFAVPDARSSAAAVGHPALGSPDAFPARSREEFSDV